MFIKTIIVIAVLALGIFSTPIITIDEPVKDYGPIREADTTLKFQFIVKNTGTTDLIIEKVKPG
jgi:archaellum component FlaG (FlaF/FlaG flagellin family)